MTLPESQHKPVIGLVGGIGSGKSLVASQFESLGCAVIDADRLAQEALDDPDIAQEIVGMLGPSTCDQEGKIDRKALGRIVFDHPDQLRQLENVIHPVVYNARMKLHSQYQSAPKIDAIVEDCPLLIEKGLDDLCDAVIFVEAEEKVRLHRVSENRGWPKQELARREKNQLGLDIKAKQADYIISNNAGEAECLKQVRRILSQILQDPS